jgi:hypothetical protein
MVDFFTRREEDEILKQYGRAMSQSPMTADCPPSWNADAIRENATEVQQQAFDEHIRESGEELSEAIYSSANEPLCKLCTLLLAGNELHKKTAHVSNDEFVRHAAAIMVNNQKISEALDELIELEAKKRAESWWDNLE